MSDPNERGENEVIASDYDVGGDADIGGVAQTVTQDEIEDILNAPEMPIEERQARLREMASRLGVRETADRGDDIDPLLAQVNEALNLLADGGHAYSTAEGTGLDPEGRSDAQSPDDTDVR